MATAQTARTKYVDGATGIRYAYRNLGLSTGVPLVMQGHYRSNMDFWDPSLLNALAAVRPVIIFDQAGVGRSTGEVATTFQGWADHIIALVNALGLKQIDLFGFSMGGAVVQMLPLTAPTLVRKLIIAGTTASQPSDSSDVTGIVWPREQPSPKEFEVLSEIVDESGTEHALTYSFFYDTDEGRAAAKAYWSRVLERNVPEEPSILKLLDDEGAGRQRTSFVDWITPNPKNSYDRLHELTMPVFVMNGDNDALVPTSRSWEMAVKIPNAQLSIYPKSGHGFLYQYAELVAQHINLFLDGFGDATPKL